jgi:hypothetical protein
LQAAEGSVVAKYRLRTEQPEDPGLVPVVEQRAFLRTRAFRKHLVNQRLT